MKDLRTGKKTKEIFFRKSGKVSGMCDSYMQIEYKDKSLNNRPNMDITKDGIYLEDDVIKLYLGGYKYNIGIDCAKDDKKRFRLFFTTED